MNDLPRQKLVEIVTKHGASIVENPRRCEGLLRDYCGAFRREISVLTMAIEERVPLDLLHAKSTPRPVLLGRLTQRLCDNLALSEQAAKWAVNSWALALRAVSGDELESIEQENAAPEQTARTASTSAPTAANVALPSAQTASANKSRPAANTTLNKPSVQKSFVVSADGLGDFASINEAVERAAANSRLLIRPGVYRESVRIDKDLEIVGDGGTVKEIIVVGENASCLQVSANKAIMRGLTLLGRGAKYGKAFFAIDILRGESILENCDISSDSLSCVAVHGVDANPTVKNCDIHDGADSGVYFFDNARALIDDCEIYRNRNVGVAITSGANPIVRNSRIFEGDNGGVVVWQNGAAGVVEDCDIFGHRLANVGISEYANPIIRRCKIYGSRDAGVFVQQNGYGKIEECDIFGNEDAEVAVSTGGNPTLRRCAIHNGQYSGVFVRDKGRATLEGCNIYDNRDAGVNVNNESVASVSRCNIHRNGKVAVRVKGGSAARVEDSDLRGNRLASWETEYGVTIERKNNRE